MIFLAFLGMNELIYTKLSKIIMIFIDNMGVMFWFDELININKRNEWDVRVDKIDMEIFEKMESE